jgi:hypothetical protein
MIPDWLHVLAIASLALAALCALVILGDVRRHPQHMWIMNVVWPVTALYGSVLALWAYFTYGRLAMDEKAQAAMERGEEMPQKALTPFPVKVGKRRDALRQRLHARRHLRRMARVPVSGGRGLVRLYLAVRRQDLRRLGRGLSVRIQLRHRVSVLHDQADARSLRR